VRYQALATIPSPLALGRRCALLAVSRSGFYAWRRRPASRRAEVNQRLVAEMQVIHREVDRTYGSPRMAPELVGRGLPCGRHRVARLMRAHGIRAKRVPTIVISPFAKRHYVDHHYYDTTSILALIEHRWHLRPLTERDARANDLAKALTFAYNDGWRGYGRD
jgi:hypothetical protein